MLSIRARFLKFTGEMFVILALLVSSTVALAEGGRLCSSALSNTKQQAPSHKLSKLEKEIAEARNNDPQKVNPRTGRPTTWGRKFELAARKLESSGKPQNSAMASRARQAWRKRWAPGMGHDSLILDTTGLPAKMHNFLMGPWFKTLGHRGLSEPFVSVKALSRTSMQIHHFGDKYPIMIQWKDVSEVQPIRTITYDGRTFRAIILPIGMTEFPKPSDLKGKILQASSGSRMSPNIDARRDPIMHLSSLLHSRREMNDRPSQAQFRELFDMIQTDPVLERKVPSLGVYAPTGAGKSRMMGIAVTERIKRVQKLQQEYDEHNAKLSAQERLTKSKTLRKKVQIVVAPKPELVNQLAADIAFQVNEDLPYGNTRIIQFGGSRSQDIKIEGLLEKLENNPEPVVIVTSNVSLNAKLRAWEGTSLLRKLLRYTNFIGLDEGHHSHEPIYSRLLSVAFEEADRDRSRRISNREIPLFVQVLTATPLHKSHDTSDIVHQTFWSLIDSPAIWAQRVKNGIKPPLAMPWVRIPEQIRRAMEVGEITAPEEYMFVDEDDVGGDIFKVRKTENGGYVTYVDQDKMQNIWSFLEPQLASRGKGVIDARPRDSHAIAENLSRLSGKNFVAIAGNSMKASEQNEIINAFRSQKPYKGRIIDSIVGPMREGMDFPFIGWYISMKKTVQFPENIQGPGRAFRLFVDKLTPKVIFFGSAPEVSIFRHIKNLTYNKVGRLHGAVKANRAFAPRRHYNSEYPGSKLGTASIHLNAVVEYLFRQQDRRTTAGFDFQNPSPKVVSVIQDELQKARTQKHAFEFRSHLASAISELASFPFYTGTLADTWQLCDEAIRAHRQLTRLIEGSKPTDIFLSKQVPIVQRLITDHELMALVSEFRAFRNWLAPATRSLIETLPLWPTGVHQVAMTVDASAEKTDTLIEALYGGAEPEELMPAEAWLVEKTRELMTSSTKSYFFHRLGYLGQVAVDRLLHSRQSTHLEDDLNRHFQTTGSIPRLFFDRLDDEAPTHESKVEANLASRLFSHLKAGRLRFDRLSPQFLEELEASDMYVNLMNGLSDLISILNTDRVSSGQRPLSSAVIYSNPSFRAVTLLRAMANAGYPNSRRLFMNWEKAVELSSEAGGLIEAAN